MELSIKNTSIEKDNTVSFQGQSEKIKILANALRLVSTDPDIKIRDLIIPDDCEKYGFAEGEHNLSVLLHFLADMLEE